MPRFEKQFVHFMWDSALEGKMVFCADYILELQQRVENNDVNYYDKVTQSKVSLPFRMTNDQSCWQFVYYDPYYELKCAREQGHKIQALFGSKWLALSNPCWNLEPEMYRVKLEETETEPEVKSVTNRELAQWLAEGYGQFTSRPGNMAMYHYVYDSSEDDRPIDEDTKVRVWGDERWHTPTREYMGLKEEQE